MIEQISILPSNEKTQEIFSYSKLEQNGCDVLFQLSSRLNELEEVVGRLKITLSEVTEATKPASFSFLNEI